MPDPSEDERNAWAAITERLGLGPAIVFIAVCLAVTFWVAHTS